MAAGDLPPAAADRREPGPLRSVQPVSHAPADVRPHARAEPRLWRTSIRLSRESLMRLAYSFEDRGRPRHVHRGLTDEPGQRQLQEVVRHWNDAWRTAPPVLHVDDDGHRLLFFDSRPCATRRSWTTEGMGAEIYRLCDSAQTPAALIHQLSARRGADIAAAGARSGDRRVARREGVAVLEGQAAGARRATFTSRGRP